MVTDSLSAKTGGGGKSRPSPLLRYGEEFEKRCSYYMSLGMSYHDYWDGDAQMAKYYREMYELRKEQRNSELWLQAAYIYEALLDASPVFNPLSKKHKPFPYRSEPIPITSRGNKESEERKKQKQLENGREAMRVMMATINKQFAEKNKKKGGKVDNGD